MSLVIQLPESIEHQLRDRASEEGLTLEHFVTQVLVSGMAERPAPEALSEADLLRKVRLNVSTEELHEFDRLTERRQNEQLTPVEYEQLVVLTHRLETAHAERMKYVLALAQLWGKPLTVTMLELGIQRKAA